MIATVPASIPLSITGKQAKEEHQGWKSTAFAPKINENSRREGSCLLSRIQRDYLETHCMTIKHDVTF
jgi:hypothetical protein